MADSRGMIGELSLKTGATKIRQKPRSISSSGWWPLDSPVAYKNEGLAFLKTTVDSPLLATNSVSVSESATRIMPSNVASLAVTQGSVLTVITRGGSAKVY